MKKRAIALAFLLRLILFTAAAFAHVEVVSAQTQCHDNSGAVIPCPPEAEHKKKPTRTPVPPTRTATPTLTSTPTNSPTIAPSLTPVPSPTSAAVLPLDGESPLKETTGFTPGPGFWFGLLGLAALLLAWFVRKRSSDSKYFLKRAARIDYEMVEDPDLLFQKQKRKGGNSPLQTEFDIPDDDSHSKDSKIMDINSSYDKLGIQADTESNEDEHEWDADGVIDADRLEKPENYFEEEHASRGGSPEPKKFPKTGDETDQGSGRRSDDD